MTGNIFVITGPSGVGKGTLCAALLRDTPRLVLSISATSRNRRENEFDGVNYYFKTRAEFEAMITHDQGMADPRLHHLLEWTEYNGHYYGTPRSAVEIALSGGQSVLLEIEVQGALMVKEKFPQACLIFIAPPSMEELERRLRGRGTESEDHIRSRLAISHQEMALQHRFDYVLTNHELDTCIQELRQVIRLAQEK